MKFFKSLAEGKWIRPARVLELYPPFFMMGAKVTYLSDDFSHLKLKLPMKWRNRNFHGTLFGGFICAATDPLAVLLCMQMFKNVDGWTKSHHVEFLKPARTDLHIDLKISAETVHSIRERLKESRTAMETFEFEVMDKFEKPIARVKTEVFLRTTRLVRK